MSQGYSGTPLAKKLSLKDGMRVAFLDMPETVAAEIAAYGLVLIDQDVDAGDLDCIHVFATERAALAAALVAGRHQIAQDGMIWVSWPKKPPNARRPSPKTQSARSACRLASSM